MAASTAASAATLVFDFNVYQAGFTGSLGTVSVSDGVGVNTLKIDVNLADNTFFQIAGGAGTLNDSLWWDLGGANIPLTYNFTAPASGAYPTGGQFVGVQYTNDAFRGGGGFMSGFDYAVQVKDSTNPKDYYGGTNNLTFTIQGTGLTLASITPQTEDGKQVYFGADLRQCIGTAPCVTGPAGATLKAAVPEPATWAMMIIGFGGVGAMIRRRRTVFAA